MAILLEAEIPEKGRLSLNIQREIDIQTSAAEAQHEVTQYVHLNISSQITRRNPWARYW